jgi:enoyl-CoA hydratase
MSEHEVLTRIEGGVGRITLNRPGEIHALTTGMCRGMTEALLAWRENPAVKLVMFDHTGERGFCAGGDIRMLAESGAADGRLAREFFFIEYRLNDLLFGYPKPTLAFMDGIVMGGGVGLSLPCRLRVATPRTTFAMPETGIGLFPDVGGGWHLSRLPDQTGLWLALTGARIKAADCLALGLASHVVATESVGDLKTAILAAPDRAEAALAKASIDPGSAPIAAHRATIGRLFAAKSIEAILAGLEAEGSDWARDQLATLATKSPQTLKVSLRQLRLGRACATFTENMAMEYRIGARVVQRHDFLEGVRAVIIDKDNAPRWNPSAVSDVDEALLDTIFAPLPTDDEWTPIPETLA